MSSMFDVRACMHPARNGHVHHARRVSSQLRPPYRSPVLIDKIAASEMDKIKILLLGIKSKSAKGAEQMQHPDHEDASQRGFVADLGVGPVKPAWPRWGLQHHS